MFINASESTSVGVGSAAGDREITGERARDVRLAEATEASAP